MSNKNPERLIFNADRERYTSCRITGQHVAQFVKDQRGWILFGPQDIRERNKLYHFCLQKLPGQKTPRVRVGCRYYTLREAWAHWGIRKPGQYYSRRNECRQAVAIIRLMLLQAQAYSLLSIYAAPIRFDSTIIKPKRK